MAKAYILQQQDTMGGYDDVSVYLDEAKAEQEAQRLNKEERERDAQHDADWEECKLPGEGPDTDYYPIDYRVKEIDLVE